MAVPPPRPTAPVAAPTRVVGGVFATGAEGDADAAPAFLRRPDQLRLANARSGLRLLQRQLRPARTWLPAFICESMSRQVAAEGGELRWYALDEKLEARELDWLDEVQRGDLVLVVDYFGFVTHHELAHAARARGAWVVEDAAHALLTEGAGSLGDFALFSPRKAAGLGEGGLLRWRAPLPGPIALEATDGAWRALAQRAGRQRARFDREGGARDWLALDQQAERLHPDLPCAMDERVLRLAAALDWADIARRRAANYRTLAQALGEFALHPGLPPGTVPHGFTVRVDNRDAVRAALFAAEIFPSLLWPMAGVVPDAFAASHRLSARVMTLHCDQRYDAADMARTAAVFLEHARA